MVLRKTCIPAKRSSVPYFRKTYVQSCLLERRGATRCFEVDRWCLLFFFFFSTSKNKYCKTPRQHGYQSSDENQQP